jgi:arsenate reductase
LADFLANFLADFRPPRKKPQTAQRFTLNPSAGAHMTITIYHNPNCGTSRTVLARLRDLGHEPTVIEYLKTPPTRQEMKKLLADLGMEPRGILRRKGTPFDELKLDDPAKTDDEILDALGAHPILMERPVVVTPRGARVCRPADRLDEILPA